MLLYLYNIKFLIIYLQFNYFNNLYYLVNNISIFNLNIINIIILSKHHYLIQ